MAKNYYITTTAPYVNAAPHVGFAAEIIRADVLARHHRLTGEEVFFNTGTDEHGKKIYEKAREENKNPQARSENNCRGHTPFPDSRGNGLQEQPDRFCGNWGGGANLLGIGSGTKERCKYCRRKGNCMVQKQQACKN